MDCKSLFEIFLEIHESQLGSSGVPQLFWEILFKKLNDRIFDGNLVFQLARIEYEAGEKRAESEPSWKLIVTAKDGICAQDANNIYLIDHAWMYRDRRDARQALIQLPDLLDRMCCLMGIVTETETQEEKIDNVMNEMWRYNQSFSMRHYGNTVDTEDNILMWYVMDEVGSAINHSDKPNFRTVPFLHMPEGITYTLLFPVRDVSVGSEVTRDFVEGQTSDPEKRRALLLPWVYSSFQEKSFKQTEPDADYFLTGRINESLPERTYGTHGIDRIKPSSSDTNAILKVFSQYAAVNDYLTDPAFEITDNEQEADVLWLVSHYKTYKELSVCRPNVFVNQFPYENVLTIKALLSIVCRRKATKLYDTDTLETYPTWLPTTYNLSTELVQFVTYFMQRANKGLDNHWICKPWNLARGMDTHITSNLHHILRLPCTGPKIAQKYVARPVLYSRPGVGQVKFDVRYVVLLKSVKPLRTYAYRNFFLRFANLPFALNDLDVYEQHFTVMNYIDEENSLYHLKCADFLVEWKNQYSDYPWESCVEPNILSVLRRTFEAAIAQPPPKGIADNPQSRAVYAADLMLEWNDSEIQPKLLEINFTPDCQRACEYYPNFYNDIFRCLFLDIDNPGQFHLLNATANNCVLPCPLRTL